MGMSAVAKARTSRTEVRAERIRLDGIWLLPFLGGGFGFGSLAFCLQGLFLAFALTANFFLSFTHGMASPFEGNRGILSLHTISEMDSFVNKGEGDRKRIQKTEDNRQTTPRS
jgi:hypothetical protein